MTSDRFVTNIVDRNADGFFLLLSFLSSARRAVLSLEWFVVTIVSCLFKQSWMQFHKLHKEFIVYAHVRRMSKCHLLTDAMMLFIDDGSPSEQGISLHILMLPKNL